MTSSRQPFRAQILPASTPSLAGGLPPLPDDMAPPPVGTLYLIGSHGGYVAPPQSRFAVVFGRSEEDALVRVGVGDDRVSRCHGRLICHGSQWWIRNEGRLPIQLPGSTLLLQGNEKPMSSGYSAMFIRSSARREHLLEARIVDGRRDTGMGRVLPGSPTIVPHKWQLREQETLVLTALAQRYLRQEDNPQPLAAQEIAVQLNDLARREDWNAHRVRNIVGNVREKLTAGNVRGLTEAEVGQPVGNKLNENLVRELLITTTLVPRDLQLLGDPDD